MEKIIQNLEHQLKVKKTPFDLFSKMAPRTPKKYTEPSPDASPAAVLICLYLNENNPDYHIVLMKRNVVKGDKHSGQISLPGGRYEKSDLNYEACALRETEEEIGIDRNKIQILGQLSDLYVYASNHIVYPFVGLLSERVTFIPDPREVHKIIETPMSVLTEPSTIKQTDITMKKGTLKNVPYYDIEGEIVWGATAIILSEFISCWNLSK